MRIREKLTSLPVILFTLLAMVGIGASFAYFETLVGGELLDMSLSGRDALARLAEMNASEKQAHFWITLTADSLYPIAYGSFFTGATLRLANSLSFWLVIPALVTVIADFSENAVQLLALNGYENMMLAKSVFSPVKFSAVFVMSLLFLVFIVVAISRKIKKNKSRSDG